MSDDSEASRGNRNSLPSQIRSAQVLLKSGQGVSETEIAKELDMAPELVRDSIQRFARSRFVSLEKTLLPALQLHVRDNGQAVPIHLVGSERRRLQNIASAQTSSQRDALRAKVILQANLGLNNCEIADQLGTDVKTVRKWRGRYNQMGLEGLHDERRSGRPLQFGAEVRQEVFTAVVLEPPDPYATWTLDLLVKHLVSKELVETISIETVSYWLRSCELRTSSRIEFVVGSIVRSPTFARSEIALTVCTAILREMASCYRLMRRPVFGLESEFGWTIP